MVDYGGGSRDTVCRSYGMAGKDMQKKSVDMLHIYTIYGCRMRYKGRQNMIGKLCSTKLMAELRGEDR